MSMQLTYSYLDNGGKSKKPRVYTRAEWGAQRDRIKLHYFDEDLNLSDVKGIMSARYDFHATSISPTLHQMNFTNRFKERSSTKRELKSGA